MEWDPRIMEAIGPESQKTLQDLRSQVPRNYPDFLEAYVEYTKGQEASEKVHRWVGLSTLAAALERKVFLDRGYYTLFPNQYIFIIGPSGIVRKSTSTRIGVDLLRGLQNLNIMSERVTAASLILQLERSGRTYTEQDPHSGKSRDMKQSATFAYASELSVFLGEVYGSISELLTDFYDCAPHNCQKPWTYENKSEGQLKIFGPCLNILGASTPTWLRNCIPIDQMEGGLASRIIFVVEHEAQKAVAWPSLDSKISAMKPKLESDLARIHALTGEMLVSDSARSWFTSWYEYHQKSLVSQASMELKFSGYFGRKGDTLLKIAMLCSVSESDSLILEPRHLERAAQLLEVAELNMFSAFGKSGKAPKSEEFQKVFDMLVKEQTVAHSTILRKLHADLTHRDLVEIIQTLQNMGAIKEVSNNNSRIVYSYNRDFGGL